MRDFIKKLVIFISFPLFLILFMDSSLRMQNTLFKEKYEGAKKLKDSIEIIILGTSRATYGVNPESFDLYTYNLSNLGQSLYFDKRITLSLLPEMKQLKYVLISVDYHSLDFSSQVNGDYWSYYGNGIKYKNTDYTWANISPTLFGYTPRVAFAMLKKRYLNLWKYGTNIIDFEVQEGVDIYKPIIKGYISFQGRDTTNFHDEAFAFSSSWYTNVIDKSIEREEIINDLEDFVEILLAKEITPILFTPPTYSKFNTYLNKAYIEKNIETCELIAKKYKIEYWDFQDSKIFSIEDFYDMEHLNDKGAIKFSTLLNDSINNIAKILDKQHLAIKP